MKQCIGCKHLLHDGFFCNADRQLTRIEDPLTGAVRWKDLRFPGQSSQSPIKMRADGGRCGPERKLYAPLLRVRLYSWLFGE
jgi:hypothetical protein